jgi:hypothetical protein
MQINTNYDLYQRNYLDNDTSKRSEVKNEFIVRSKKLDETLAKEDVTNSFKSNIELNSKERNFFKQMFPESSLKIENHILFNRNGKTINANSYSKGQLVDAAV